MPGDVPFPSLVPEEDEQDGVGAKAPGQEHLAGVYLRAPEGVAPTGEVHEVEALVGELLADGGKFLPVCALQGLTVVVDVADALGKQWFLGLDP